jgi:organic hydroperoxide reductase OsmC/OhrA
MPHTYHATVQWQREVGAVFTDNRYSRAHEWRFDEGVVVPASPAPSSVKAPMSRADAVDPEEALVAACSSCHMLFFLSFAGRQGFVIDSYTDTAVGVMTKNDGGKLYISAITLNPKIVWSGDKQPTDADIAALHERAHAECYIANSIRATVTVAGMPAHH